MKCRKLEENQLNSGYDVIWFGSHGIDEYAHSINKNHQLYVNAIYKTKEIYDSQSILTVTDPKWDILYKDSLSTAESPSGWIFNKNYVPVLLSDLPQEVKIIKSIEEFKSLNLDYSNYAEKQRAIRDALIQRLSLLKGELVYNQDYGLPLVEKFRTTGILDSSVLNVINEFEEIESVNNFQSKIVNGHTYSVSFDIITIYAPEEMKVKLDI